SALPAGRGRGLVGSVASRRARWALLSHLDSRPAPLSWLAGGASAPLTWLAGGAALRWLSSSPEAAYRNSCRLSPLDAVAAWWGRWLRDAPGGRSSATSTVGPLRCHGSPEVP